MQRFRQAWLAIALFTVVESGTMPLVAADASALDYEQPRLLTGTVYETSSGTNKILFTFKRTAVRTNATVYVLRDFFHPNGSIAAREEAIFERGRLVSFQLDERQTGAHGSARIAADPKNGTKQKLSFDWITSDGKKKTDDEMLQPNTIVSDMIPYFIVTHWNELARGSEVNFRFVAQSRLETVGFKLVKESELTWRGKPAVRLRMEASNLIIAQLVDPIFFIVEKNGEHRVLEYIGRTTPKARDGNKWKDLGARTLYDWK